MSADRLREELEGRAPGEWELYQKRAESREHVASPDSRSDACRREHGWAARWWQAGSPRFAAASSPQELEGSIADAGRIATVRAPSPEWPTAQSPLGVSGEKGKPVEPPPDLFNTLSRLVLAESRGDARLSQLSIRRGASLEQIENARGLDISIVATRLDGVALAIGRRGSRACEARVLFRWEGEPDVESLARRLSDRATLPLSDRPAPVTRGEWLLDPSVAAALLAGIAPVFCVRTLPKWVSRRQFAAPSVTIADDAIADASCDGEGTPSRRVVLVEKGGLRGRLHDLLSARKTGAKPTGHGVRPSYRTPPAVGPRRLFFETASGTAPLELLSSVKRGLFAAALTAPLRLDLEHDRYEAEFTGISIGAGRAQGPVANARARGQISQLLRRICGVATDGQFFPMPYPVGAPTLLIERAEFE